MQSLVSVAKKCSVRLMYFSITFYLKNSEWIIFLKKYSDELSIEENSLKKISEKWIEFLSKHGNELSLSSSLNKRNKKTENALSDFILKNCRLRIEKSHKSKATSEEINSDPGIYKTMNSIYQSFLESDEKGFNTLESFKNPPNTGYTLFKSAVIMAILRKISKLGLDFSFSPDSGISNLTFARQKKY